MCRSYGSGKLTFKPSRLRALIPLAHLPDCLVSNSSILSGRLLVEKFEIYFRPFELCSGRNLSVEYTCLPNKKWKDMLDHLSHVL